MEFAGKNGGMMNTGEYWGAISDELGGRYRDNGNSGKEQVDANVVRDLGAEVLSATERKVESGEQASEEEKQVREEFDKWLESMEGPLDEYWQRLEGKWWVEKQAPLSEYVAPRYDLLRANAKKFVRKKMPELTVVGAEARAEMATKVALQRLAEEEAKLLKTTRVGFGGKLRLAKDWNVALLMAANTGMERDLKRVYGEDAERPDGDDLSERELVAWWAASEPESEWPKRALELLETAKEEEVPEPGAATEGVKDAEEVDEAESVAEEDKKPIIHMNSDDIKIVSVPEPLVNTAMVEKEQAEDDRPAAEVAERESLIQKILGKLPVIGRSFSDHVNKAIVEAARAAMSGDDVGAKLVPAAKTEVVVEKPDDGGMEKQEAGAEELGQSEMIERAIITVSQAMQSLRGQTDLLEDYNPAKLGILETLNSILTGLTDLQAKLKASSGDFEEGKRQREAGMRKDLVEVGDSNVLRKGEVILGLLISSGILEPGKTAEEYLGVLDGLREKLSGELDRATLEFNIERDNYLDILGKLLDVAPYLVWLREKEADEAAKGVDERDGKIVDFPSSDVLRKAASKGK